MCGLTGYYNFNFPAEVTNRPLLEMLALQRHRGPDDQGVLAVQMERMRVEDPGCLETRALREPANLMLGFNRLSILDLSENGHQPMRRGDGQVILLMNGEIYNAFDFRQGLINKGYHFTSSTDTEIVLNLYLEHGFDRMIRMLNGMFAVVICDLRSQRLYLARDRFGIKPLYVLQEAGRLAFSSEMKSFKALPGFRFALEEAHLDEFLLFRNLVHRTLFKDIVNIAPGEYWTVNSRGQVSKTIYYDLLHDTGELLSSEKGVQELDLVLDRSVQRQLMSDVKLGCQLSGGVDSSMVSYYAARQAQSGQFESVSIVFNEPDHSEERYIDYAARCLGLNGHKFTLDATYYLEHLDKATWHFEQPLNHPNTIGIYLLSQEARKYVTVLLSGEGADEALAGYGRFLDAVSNPWWSRTFLRRLRENREQVVPFLRYYIDPKRRMIMASAFGALAISRKLKADFRIGPALAHRLDLAARIQMNGLRGYRQYELLTYLPDLLMRQDKMSMAHSIENRVPFLDNELIHLALRLPDESLVSRVDGRLETKWALKELCARTFGRDFAYRPKMGFGIPLKAFMNTPLFEERLKSEIIPGMESRGVFETAPIRAAAGQLDEASAAQLEALWIMSGFESWARQYLDA